MLPNGAYVSLEALQQLRYLAKQCTSSKQGKSQALLGGQHKSRAISRGMEFEEVRQYQPGDDIRSIDWRVTARTQITHSKRYSEEKEKPIVTAVDQRRSQFFGSKTCFKSVYACHLAAIINWATLHAGDRSGGIVLGTHNIQETRAVRSHKNVNRWLQQLSVANQQLSATPNIEPTFSDFLERVIHSTQTGTQVFIISDFYDLNKQCEKLLFQLARHHHVNLLWVVDPLEESLPKTQQIQVSNGQSQTPVWLPQQATATFANQFVAKQQYLTQLTQKLGIALRKASTQTSPIDIINGLSKK
jgi:uncharacterized protein (DUF58 family)